MRTSDAWHAPGVRFKREAWCQASGFLIDGIQRGNSATLYSGGSRYVTTAEARSEFTVAPDSTILSICEPFPDPNTDDPPPASQPETIIRTIYVDGSSTQVESGTRCRPFKTVTRAHNFTQDGDRIQIQAGCYPEQVTFAKRVTVESAGGTVTIGRCPP